MDDRIKLAEAMGWKPIPDDPGWWLCPENGVGYEADELPDPFTDANDTEALIDHVSEHYSVIVHFKSDRHPAYVDFYRSNDTLNHPTHKWYGDDWKKGVCELVLKVLDTVTDGQVPAK